MRTYSSPEVTYLGDLASLTGLTSDPTEQDTFVSSEGVVGHAEGPVSEIFCETTNDLEICQ